jgi:hypothetical protein
MLDANRLSLSPPSGPRCPRRADRKAESAAIRASRIREFFLYVEIHVHGSPPEPLADTDDRHSLHFAGWRRRKDFEQFVKGSEAAGKGDERLPVAKNAACALRASTLLWLPLFRIPSAIFTSTSPKSESRRGSRICLSRSIEPRSLPSSSSMRKWRAVRRETSRAT